MRVLLAGGGTAGHALPMLALADCLRRRDPTTAVLCLGTREGIEARLVPERGYDLSFVPRLPFPPRPSGEALLLGTRVAAAVRAASAAVEAFRPDVVVGFGGYVSTPAYLAARRGRVPVVVHEANARPGLANRLGARLTRHVAVTFPGTPLPNAVRTGLPLRTEITTLDRAARRDEARATLGLDPARRTLLVFGGSLGAQRLNLAFGGAAEALADADIQVLHAAGRGKEFSPPARPGGPSYVVVPYLDRMDLAFAAADAVACRAGAATVSEVTALGLPAAYVPLPIGNGEQAFNAAPVATAGGGILVADDRCTPEWVAGEFVPLLADTDRLGRMGRAAAGFGVLDGDERLADLVQDAAHGVGAARTPGRRRG